MIKLIKTNANETNGVDISEGMLKIGINKVKNRKLNNTISMEIADSRNYIIQTTILMQLQLPLG